MAMGNYCYTQGIECNYATVTGKCQDDIYEDYGLCEMLGSDMPYKYLTTDERRYLACHGLEEYPTVE